MYILGIIFVNQGIVELRDVRAMEACVDDDFGIHNVRAERLIGVLRENDASPEDLDGDRNTCLELNCLVDDSARAVSRL